MRFTVQRFRFIAVTVLSILVLTIAGVVSLSPAYACTFTATLSASTIVQGGSLTLSGDDSCNPSGENIFANTFETSSCPPTGDPPGSQVGGDGLSGVTGAYSGVPITFFTSPPGFGGPGTYCVHVFSTSIPSSDGVNVAFTVTSATPIPEYPFGLAVLAIFMMIGYGVIRRRTITKQK